MFTNANLIQILIEYLAYTNKYLWGNLEFTKYGHTYFLRLASPTTIWDNNNIPLGWGRAQVSMLGKHSPT